MTMTIHIPPGQEKVIHSFVENNIYSTYDDVIEDALRLLIAARSGLYSRNEIIDILSKNCSMSSTDLIRSIRVEEEL